jgi:Cu(I)/Ag(I) efflux system periplasmic protein CusF
VRLRVALALVMSAAALAFAEPPQRFGPNEGQVLEVDRQAGEITIQHGYLPELDMDPMSMVFIVADVTVLEGVKKGDLVKFKPGLVHGRFAVMSIERAAKGP